MLDKLEALATPRRRKYLYKVSWSLLALLGVYGVLTGQQIAAWALLAAAILGIADSHTDPSTPTGMPRRQPNVDAFDEAGQ